jgi:alpha-1,2-glucosyltransferase
LSWVINLVLGDCSTSFLRALNAGAVCIIFLLAYDILRTLNRRNPKRPSLYDVHSALNISLFPPLFFFSGLYYTDVISTLVVLGVYAMFLKSVEKGTGAPWEGFTLIPPAILALYFRQTNIFWVAVFPAGLALVNVLKLPQQSYEDELNKFVTKEDEERWRCSVPECHELFTGHRSWRKHVEKHTELTRFLKSNDVISIIKKSWSGGYVYDCPVQHASLEGMQHSHQSGSRPCFADNAKITFCLQFLLL